MNTITNIKKTTKFGTTKFEFAGIEENVSYIIKVCEEEREYIIIKKRKDKKEQIYDLYSYWDGCGSYFIHDNYDEFVQKLNEEFYDCDEDNVIEEDDIAEMDADYIQAIKADWDVIDTLLDD